MNIAIAGCGTAGMAAALLLARDGHRVMVFERFDELRPLGSGLMLQPTGLAVLDQLGLATAAIAAGQRIDRLCGKAGNRTVLDVRYSSMRGRLFGVGNHRSAPFSLLHDALKSDGAAIATGREVTGVERRSDGIRLLFALGSAEGPFDLAVDALGTRSALSPDVGRELRYGALWTNVNLPRDEFDRHMLSQRYRRASVMAGVLPIGGEQAGFFWSLRAKDHATWLATGLESWKSDVRSLWPATSPLLDQIGSHDELTFARYAHKTIHRPAGDRLIHIGDSWHSASPQLGQGANMALLDAFALARALREAGSVGDGLAAVVSMRRSHVRLYQLLTALLTPVYQSDSRIIPPARDWLMGPASKIWPMTSFQVALASGLVGSPLRRLGIDFAPPQTGS